MRISSERCKAIENLLLSIEMSCPNEKHGCKEKISYTDRKHEDECIYLPYYCPLSGCDFAASSEVLSNHFSHKHGDSQIKFSYGHSFDVSLKANDETIILFSIIKPRFWEMQSIFAALVPTLLSSSIGMIYWLDLRYAN